MPNKAPRSVLLTFMGIRNYPAARDYLQRETQKMAVPLHDLANYYDRGDWPLLVATMESFAAGLRSTMSDKGRDLADKLRAAQGVVVVDMDAMRRGG